MLAAVVDAVAELLADAARRGRRLRARPPGGVGPRLGRRVRRPADADRRLAGQALAGGARPAGGPRGGGPARPAGFRSTPTSRPPSSPGCSSTTRRSRALGSAARCGWAPSTRSSATASAPASPPIPRRRRGPSSSESTPRAASIPAFARSSGSRSTCCRRSATRRATSASSPTRAGRPRCRCCGQTVDQQAALAGAGAVVPGRVKATYGTGVFVLAHVGEEVPEPAGGLLPTVAWAIDGRIEYALDGGVFAAGAMLEWLCRELGVAADPPALGELARDAEDSGGVRVLPGLAGPRGAMVEAERARGPRRDRRRDDQRAGRARGARGDRLARRGRRRGDPGVASRSTASGSTAGSRTSR